MHQAGQSPGHPVEMKLYSCPRGAIGQWGRNTGLQELVVLDPGKPKEKVESPWFPKGGAQMNTVAKADAQLLPQI